MSRQNPYLSSQYGCRCYNPQTEFRACSSYEREPQMEDFTDDDNDDDDCTDYRYPRQPIYDVTYRLQDQNPVLDDQTWNDLSNLRQKACRFIISDSDDSLSTKSSHCKCSCPKTNYRDSSLVRKASDLVDYVPESEFLKKIKEKCQYWENNQPYYVPVYNQMGEYEPYKCQKDMTNSRPVTRSGDQYNSGKLTSSADESGKNKKICNCCCSKQQSKGNGGDLNNKNICKGVSNKMENQGVFRYHEDRPASANVILRNEEKKSEHVSRSKKPGEGRGRRKRKPESGELGQDDVSLKKPHENSCERCWRYASPSRSPVNKPEQRYDPNFRKAHSCTDFQFKKEDGKDVIDRNVSPCKNLQPVVNKNFVPLPEPNLENQKSSTRIKELLYDFPQFKAPEKSSIKTRTSDNFRVCEQQKPQDRMYSEVQEIRPRPRSCAAGLHSRAPGNYPGFIDDVAVAEYKEIHIRPRIQSFPTDDPCNRLPKSFENRAPCPRENPCSSSRTNDLQSSCRQRGGSRDGRRTSRDMKSNSATTKSYDKDDRGTNSSKRGAQDGNSTWEATMYNEIQGVKSAASSAKKSGSKTPGGSGKAGGASSRTKSASKSPKAGSKSPKSGKDRRKSSTSKGGSPRRENGKSGGKLGPNRSQSHIFNETCGKYYFEPKEPCRQVNNVSRPCNEPSGYTPLSKTYTGPPHPIRECGCSPRIPQYKTDEEFLKTGGHIFCCHCRWQENHRNQQCARGNQQVNQRQDVFYERPFVQPNFGERGNNMDYRTRDLPQRNDFSEKLYMQNRPNMRERTLPCPYREYTNERAREPKSCNKSEFRRYPPGSNENHPPRPQHPRHSPWCSQDPQEYYSPTKYSVYYMTKGKDTKNDEVEVLVEELTQTSSNKKDSKSRDLAEKMKKVLECQSDSMALRFQKGISDSGKNFPNSRVLYF